MVKSPCHCRHGEGGRGQFAGQTHGCNNGHAWCARAERLAKRGRRRLATAALVRSKTGQEAEQREAAPCPGTLLQPVQRCKLSNGQTGSLGEAAPCLGTLIPFLPSFSALQAARRSFGSMAQWPPLRQLVSSLRAAGAQRQNGMGGGLQTARTEHAQGQGEVAAVTPRDEEEMQEKKEKSKRGRRQTALGDITKPPPPGRGREWEKAGRRGRRAVSANW